MRCVIASTAFMFALVLASPLPELGQAQGQLPAPKKVQPPSSPKAPSGTASGYQPDYRYRPGMPGYPYASNPYTWYYGAYPPYGGGGGYGSYGYMPFGGYGMGYGGNSPYGMFPPPPPPPVPSQEPEVTIYDNYFQPQTVYVTPGGRVRWTNKGHHNHTVTEFAGTWTSKDIRPGQSFTFRLPTTLNYSYYCDHHPLEMNGYIVVRPAPPQPPPQQNGYNNPGY